jgi:osmotically-inducible protein OsmY
MMNRSLNLIPVAVLAAAALVGCNRPGEERTAGQKVDQAVGTVKSEAQQAKQAADNAVTTATSAAADAMITTKVNAALAADNELKATKIDVDTSNGHVVLSGSAPSPQSRERASRLAHAVEGVVAVDNRLTVTKG